MSDKDNLSTPDDGMAVPGDRTGDQNREGLKKQGQSPLQDLGRGPAAALRSSGDTR